MIRFRVVYLDAAALYNSLYNCSVYVLAVVYPALGPSA